MSIVKHGQKSLRVVLPDKLYEQLKKECPDYGDMSKLIRKLLTKYLDDLHHEEDKS